MLRMFRRSLHFRSLRSMQRRAAGMAEIPGMVVGRMRVVRRLTILLDE